MTVGFPVLAEYGQGSRGQWYRAVLGPFAVAHVDEHASTVNIGHLEMGALLQPEATRVNGCQASAIAQ